MTTSTSISPPAHVSEQHGTTGPTKVVTARVMTVAHQRWERGPAAAAPTVSRCVGHRAVTDLTTTSFSARALPLGRTAGARTLATGIEATSLPTERQLIPGRWLISRRPDQSRGGGLTLLTGIAVHGTTIQTFRLHTCR